MMQQCSEDEVEEMLEQIKQRYGEVPYILTRMRNNPKLLLSKILYDAAVLDGFNHIDAKTVELISIAVASALKCRACIDLHVRAAKRMGISDEAIMTSMLIAASLSNAAVLSEATRSLADATDDEASQSGGCPECRIPVFEE
ncbi:MAG TPA: carboxymuconolactone decarboxylase family protein [Methermicoccus shengliensis]|uniref:Carboxymuconolactone decarboxylase family protein n=2 Tax=Methermicoccus shengliensis TaxID=660064 RepID=A0A832VZG0_9EURY|nr:carboxymuconolactone decarboxylase family protein [Methermicoccus shengliensis]